MGIIYLELVLELAVSIVNTDDQNEVPNSKQPNYINKQPKVATVPLPKMPPKANPRTRRSQTSTPDHISIYEMLADKDQDNSVRELAKKMEALAKHDIDAVEKSYRIFVLRLCGLDACVGKINWREPVTSLAELLEEMCEEENHKSAQVSELFLINEKSKFHKEFLKRVRDFLTVSINDENTFTSQADLIKSIYEYLHVISKCKMRNIRHCSVVLAGLVMRRVKLYYEELVKEKSSKKSGKILNMLDHKYLEEIIKPRLKDIDQLIREKCFEIAGELLMSMEELLTADRLGKIYTPMLGDNKAKITELCLKSILKLFEINKEKMSAGISRNLSTYASEIIKPIQQLVLLPNKNSCLAMDALLAIHSFNPDLNSLKPKLIAKVFQIHGYQKFQQGLKKAVLIFFKSLINFSTKQDLIQHRSLLLIEITHLLCSINSSRLLSTILHQFFKAHRVLFSFDDIFLLLLTEYYHQNGTDVELQEKELNVLCMMVCQLNVYLRHDKSSDKEKQKDKEKEKEQQAYNKNVLTSCKEIYYEKIPKHHSICPLYLRLFALLYTPIQGNISNYLNFVEEKTYNFIRDQQFLTISGQNLVLAQQIVHECVAIAKLITHDQGRIDPIIKSFGVPALCERDKFDDVDIIKAAALVSKFNMEELASQKILKKILSGYTRLSDKITKLQTLTYSFNCLKHIFTSLFNSPSHQKHEEYLSIRNIFMDFVIETVLASSSEDTVVKVAGFNVLCRAFRLVSNSRISDLPPIYFEPTAAQMEVVYGFVAEYIRFEEEEVSEATMMMASIGLESQEIREQIIHNLFAVYCECLRLALNKNSIKFIENFILSNSLVLKPYQKYLDNFLTELTKAQIAAQNNNRFIFWRLYMQLSHISVDEQQKQDKIVSRLLDSYFKYRKTQAQVKSLLSNKLMLFAADSIDKSMNNANYGGLLAMRALLGKTKRRFQKETLQRLSIFFCSKIGNAEDKNVSQMKKFLAKISKVKKSKQKSDKDEQSNSSQSQKQSEKDSNQENGEQNDENEGNSQNIMVEKTPGDPSKRATRSKTKRKTKN